MLTPDQAGILGEWRVRSLWKMLSMRDKYTACVQMKWRKEAKSARNFPAMMFDGLWEPPRKKKEGG